MSESLMAKLLEHNNWANQLIIQACAGLSEAQLDAEPPAAAYGSIRATLLHLVQSQQAYLNLLTIPVETRPKVQLTFVEAADSARRSGEALVALVNQDDPLLERRHQTADGFIVVPWVLIVQIINHATEHREQIKAQLTALGVTPPEIDGWMYGEATHALVLITEEKP